MSPASALPRLLIAFAFLCLPGIVWGGNCSLAGDYLLKSRDGNFIFATHGLSGTISSTINHQVQPTSINISITTSHVVERIKAYAGAEQPICNTPSGFFDPYATHDRHGDPYASAIQYIELEYFDCYAHEASSVRQGVQVDGIYFVLSNSSMPDFLYHIAFEVSNGTLYEYPNNDTTHTHGDIYAYTWLADRVKITVKMEEIPWIGDSSVPAQEATFLSLHFKLDVSVIPCTYAFCDAVTTSITINATEAPLQQLRGEWEKYFILDGVPWYTSEVRRDCELGSFEGTFPVSLWVGIPLCSSLYGHYRELIYDPTLASSFILDDPTIPDSPGNQPLAKTNKIAVIVGASVGGFVFVALIVFVALFILAEPVRNAILPSTKPIATVKAKSNRQMTSSAAASSGSVVNSSPSQAASATSSTSTPAWTTAKPPTI
jgi:hypothetical protein